MKEFPTLRVRALILSEGHLLLCFLDRRTVAFLPGGRVEPHETLEVALRREMQEEAGASVTALRYLGAIENLWSEADQPIHDLSHYFHVECDGLRPPHAPECSDDGVRLAWVPLSQLAQQPIKPDACKSFLQRWVAGNHETWWALERNE